jgi:serpin B
MWTSLGLLSCGDSNLEPAGDFDVAGSSKSRNLAPAPTATDLAAQVAGNTDLALDLYAYLAESTADNLFFSPHSISTALAMTWAGANGQTEQQMAETLHFVLPQERLHPVFNELDLQLESRAEGGEGSDGQGFRLRLVNSSWAQRDYPILTTFLDVLAESYGAAVRLVDFIGDAEGARQTINAWVEGQTEDRIQDLLPTGSVDALTRLVLVNAVYFNAAWAQPFGEEYTYDATFFRPDGGSVTVPMMHQEDSFPYARGDGWQAIELPYEGEDLGMLILVPDRGRFAEIEGHLDAAGLTALVGALADREVRLSLPRWTLAGTTFSLKEALSELGMASAFTPEADFSAITGARDLWIDDVLHQAFVKVDESGTEAAAATAVPLTLAAAPGDTVVLDVDRPFLYLIRDRPTGAVLFLGRVMDPSAS